MPVRRKPTPSNRVGTWLKIIMLNSRRFSLLLFLLFKGIISPEYSLEGLMLELKLQYFATWCKELTHLKRPWCWERLKAGGERDNRGWDGCMASLTQWTRVWVNSRSWWWTGRPGMLQFMGSQSQTQLSDWPELNWTTPLLLLVTVSLSPYP